jgi:hypothetical protein
MQPEPLSMRLEAKKYLSSGSITDDVVIEFSRVAAA